MTVDDIYKSIAQNMMDNLVSHWSEAYLTVERDASDAIGFKGGYINESKVFTSFKFRKFERRRDLPRDFHKLYEIMTVEDANNWNKAKFTLFPSGKFSIDFEWDQDMADEIEALSKE